MTTTNPMIEKWKPAALALQNVSDTASVPMHVLLGEAVDVARFTQRRWTTVRDGAGVIVAPGLDLVESRGLIKAGIDQEILELYQAVTSAESAYRLTVAAPDSGTMERARFVLDEITAGLEYLFDDGAQDENDARVDKLATEHANSLSQDAIALALNDYAELADNNREGLQGLGGIDLAIIDEARELAHKLRERSAQVPVPLTSVDQSRELRNRFAALLLDRMTRVRAAARFVFRHHPDIVREATSTYERRRRAARRRAQKKEAEQAQTQSQPTTEVAASAS